MEQAITSRYISLDGKQQSYTVDHLLTQKERSCFADYEPESLYKNVAGLNALQFRNAMKFKQNWSFSRV